MPSDPTLPSSPENEAARRKSLVLAVIRLTGALFMIGGTAVGFDVGGIANAAGFADGVTEKALGGAIFAAGVADFIIVPRLLSRNLP